MMPTCNYIQLASEIKLGVTKAQTAELYSHSIHCLFPKLSGKAPKALSRDTNSPSLSYNSTILELYYNKSCIWPFYTTTNNQIW